MVLEETLVFDEENDADIFIRFLREKNCRAQKKNESSIFEETEMVGTTGNLIRLIETKIESEVQEGEKDPIEREVSIPDPGKSAYPADRKVSFAESNAKMLASLKSIRDYAGDIMTRFNCGDIIFTDEDLKRSKEQIRAGFEDDPGDALKEILRDEFQLQSNLLTLEDNGVVETRPEGICLIKKIDPNDLLVERRPWGTDEVDRETLKQYGIALKLHIDFQTATRVIIDPRIHFTCKSKEVKEILENLEADEFSEEELERNLSLKGLAIDSILTAIETAGRISLADLIRNLKEVVPDMIDDEYQVAEHFSPEFITGITNDLRKIGAIEGNDRKMRAAR
jgi:hypothetical protein